jgi:LysM repeat protein
MKGRWVSLVVVLVLLNYLIISTVWNAVSHDSSSAPTATRTPKPTFTYEAEVRTYVTSTATPRPATGVARVLTPVVGPTLAPTNTPVPSTATSVPPTPTVTSSPAPATVTATITPAPTATPVIHVVAAGEMLLTIAIEYDISVEEIKQANELESDLIYVGQELLIPQPMPNPEATGAAPVIAETPQPSATSFVHIVTVGENLAWIADRYAVTVEAIAEANGIKASDLIYVGQRLIIPATPATPTPGPTTTSRSHTIQAGESLSGIAYEYDVSIEDLMRANDISDPDTIYIGQVLIIP